MTNLSALCQKPGGGNTGGSGSLKCQLCQTRVLSISALNAHLQDEHGVRPLMNCNSCGESLPQNQDPHLVSHVCRGVAANRCAYKCKNCDIVLHSEDQWKIHENIHSLKVNCQFRCGTCDVFLPDFEMYQKHEHTVTSRRSTVAKEDKIFDCRSCGVQCTTLNAFSAHMAQHEKEPGPFPCGVCGQRYASASGLVKHKQQEHSAQARPVSETMKRRLYCKKCDLHFGSIRERTKHRQTHLSEKNYECDICGKKYKFKESWAQHKVGHPENTDILCRDCGTKFDSQEELVHHTTTRISCEVERVICEICGKSVMKRYTGVHMARHRGPERKCDVCGKLCFSAPELRFHRNTHFDDKPYQCKFCSHTCAHPTNIIHHMYTQHLGPTGFIEIDVAGKEKPFMCDTCGERWTTEEALKEHQIYHGPKTIKCKKCSEVFFTKYDLFAHLLKHRSYECEVCEKTFHVKDALNVHMRYAHTGETPYECKFCDKKYKTRQDLMYHEAIHTGEKKFTCELCGKRFITKGNLNNHLRTHPEFEGAYKCRSCEACFRTFTALREHSVDVHGAFNVTKKYLL